MYFATPSTLGPKLVSGCGQQLAGNRRQEYAKLPTAACFLPPSITSNVLLKSCASYFLRIHYDYPCIKTNPAQPKGDSPLAIACCWASCRAAQGSVSTWRW